MPTPTKFSAWLKRTLWTVLANALGTFSGPVLFNVGAWKSAGITAVSTLVGALLIYARAQADALPEVPKP